VLRTMMLSLAQPAKQRRGDTDCDGRRPGEDPEIEAKVRWSADQHSPQSVDLVAQRFTWLSTLSQFGIRSTG
jgi:hypothetical protein